MSGATITANAYTFNVDSFAMFKLKDAGAQKAQGDLAASIMGTEFQEVFNLNKGSIPVRMGMNLDKFDACAKASAADFVATANTILTPTSPTSDVTLSEKGIYVFELTVSEAARISKDKVTITVDKAFTTGTGSLTRSVWLDVEEGTLANLTTYDPQLAYPHFEDLIPGTEPPRNWADYYGQRLKGALTVPVAGRYTFWIASDDGGELWISSDANPANKRRIASVTGSVSPLQWNAQTSQQSVGISLEAGQSYYIEALQKEGVGGDHLAVAWQGPSFARQVIDAIVLETIRGAGDDAVARAVDEPDLAAGFVLRGLLRRTARLTAVRAAAHRADR